MMLSVLSFAAFLVMFSTQVICERGKSSLEASNNQTREYTSEELIEGSTEVEEIFLDAQFMQLQKENLNLKQALETQKRQLENTRKINQQLNKDKQESMEKNQQLTSENIRQSSQIGELQRNLQSTQATLYILQPKLTLLQNNLTITLQSLENATVYARNVESMLETELQMKSTHQEEALLERQMHQITKQTLEDVQSFSKFVMNLTKIQNVRILKLENVTKSMDIAMDQMKEKEKAYMSENIAYQNEIIIQQTATSKERDQKEKLKIALTQQSQLGKIKERMLRVLRNALTDMTVSIPNCTSLATQAQKSQINAHLEKEDPMKLLISQCNLFNSSSINLQDIYVQMNTQLKGQLETKKEIINHQANENKELVKSLEERKQLANIQSQSLQLLTAEVDLLIPNDFTRTRVRRNLDGTIKSANICQCLPEAPGASHLELSNIQLTCPQDMTILGKDSKMFSLPCSGSVCSVENMNWPQCEDILQKAWTPWVYDNCSQISIGNQTIQCGGGERSRTREVRSSSKDPWRREAVLEPCQQCSISQGHEVTILPPALATALNSSLEILNPALYLQREEKILTEGNLITTLPKLSKEYQISFDFKVTDFGVSSPNMIYFTIFDKDEDTKPGGRNPGVWLISGKIYIGIDIGTGATKNFYLSDDIVPLNQWMNLDIRQKLENGKYMLTILVDGEKKYQVENSNPQEYSNVKVYAGAPWWDAVQATIRNFFLHQS